MKTVTSNFLTAQKSPYATVVRQVYYKKRYWVESTKSYSWESSWTQLPESEVVQVSPISWNLDNDILNEFKVSNVTINVDNSNNKWRFDNNAGFFKQDSASPIWGYEPYWTKFQIRVGYVLYDGSTEMVTVFTGVATEYTQDSEQKTCQILISGLESLLTNAKAEKIATTVTEENVGTGNGSTTVFTTLNPGVGFISEVSVAGIKQVEGSNYTVSNTNTATLGATVTFTVAPDSGKVVRVSYLYWPQNKKFEELVSLLLTAGGISAGNQVVSPVSFANSVLNAVTYTTQADWDTGTKTITESATSSGNLKIDWAGSGIRSAKTWSTSTSGWTGVTNWSSDGTYLNFSTIPGNELIYRSMPNACGVFEIKHTRTNNSPSVLDFIFLASGSNDGNKFQNQYFLQISHNSTNRILLGKEVYGSGSTTLGLYDTTIGTSENTFKIVRRPTGQITVFMNSTQIIDAVDTSLTSGDYVAIRGNIGGLSSGSHKVRDFVMPIDSIDAIWSSPTIDMTAAPTSFETLTIDDDNDGSAVSYETRTSTDGISWDAWTAVSGSFLPLSALKRYAQVRSRFVQNSTDNFDPVLSSLSFRYITSSTLVTLPALTGESVYGAIQKIGEFTNYEYGFTPDEKFFFRPKSTGNPVLTISQSDYVSRIGGFDSGYSRTYGVVRATYGSKTTEISDDGLNPKGPVARLSTARYEISPDSNLQIPASADIATGVASNLFQLLSRPRKRMKVVTKMLPQIDLSDVLTVNLVNNTPPVLWYLGDPTVYLGDSNFNLWGEGEQMIYGLNGKVIASRYDTDKHQTEFELEEVPS